MITRWSVGILEAVLLAACTALILASAIILGIALVFGVNYDEWSFVPAGLAASSFSAGLFFLTYRSIGWLRRRLGCP